MNTVSIIGRITRESELRYSGQGTAIYKNTIAVPRRFKRDESDFINLLAFKQAAELLANHTNKGDLIGIEGHVQTGSYEKDGKKVYTFDVVVDNITFIGGKKEDKAAPNKPTKKFTADPSSPFKDDPFAGGINVSSEDLPF